MYISDEHQNDDSSSDDEWESWRGSPSPRKWWLIIAPTPWINMFKLVCSLFAIKKTLNTSLWLVRWCIAQSIKWLTTPHPPKVPLPLWWLITDHHPWKNMLKLVCALYAINRTPNTSSHPSPYSTTLHLDPTPLQQNWYIVSGIYQTHQTFTENSRSYEMAFIREPFECTMVYNDTLTYSKEGQAMVKRLIQTMIQTMKEHDEHWNCYNKEQHGLPGENKHKWLTAALEAGRHTLVLFTCAKDFLDKGDFLINIQTAHNIASKRTEYKSKVIPIVYRHVTSDGGGNQGRQVDGLHRGCKYKE